VLFFQSKNHTNINYIVAAANARKIHDQQL